MIHYANLHSEDAINTGAIFEGREIYRSARLEKLRKKVFASTPRIDSSRAKAVTESYMETEGYPIPLRRGHGFEKNT